MPLYVKPEKTPPISWSECSKDLLLHAEIVQNFHPITLAHIVINKFFSAFTPLFLLLPLANHFVWYEFLSTSYAEILWIIIATVDLKIFHWKHWIGI